MYSENIRVIAICVFQHKGKILVFEAFDSAKNSPFYRPLGGGVEFGETAEEAIRREIWEEVGEEIADLKLLDIIENHFVLEERRGHEIVFVFDGRFVNPNVYKQEAFEIYENGVYSCTAHWRSLNFFDAHHRLVPEVLTDLLASPSQTLK